MTAFDYSRMQATSDRLMTRFSQGVCTLTRVTPGTPNPSTPWVQVSDSTVTYALKATVKSVEDKYIDGTSILATDSMVTASPVMTKTHVDGVAVTNVDEALEVQPGDVLKIDGKGVTIVREMRVPKAGTCVAWKFVFRA